jgi:hypothetical protein
MSRSRGEEFRRIGGGKVGHSPLFPDYSISLNEYIKCLTAYF